MTSPAPNSASDRQIEANRRNAENSTGPRTAEGKSAASKNATRYGLFTANLQVRPDEAEAYDTLRYDLLVQFLPDGPLEECVFLEIVNAQWRLLRCTLAERAIKPLQNEADLEFAPAPHDFASPAQKAIDRARAAAKLSLRRDIIAIRELQAERWKRAELLSEAGTHPHELGAVPVKEAAAPNLTTIERARIHIRAHNQQTQWKFQEQAENGAAAEAADVGAVEKGRPYPNTSSPQSNVEVDEPNVEVDEPNGVPLGKAA